MFQSNIMLLEADHGCKKTAFETVALSPEHRDVSHIANFVFWENSETCSDLARFSSFAAVIHLNIPAEAIPSNIRLWRPAQRYAENDEDDSLPGFPRQKSPAAVQIASRHVPAASAHIAAEPAPTWHSISYLPGTHCPTVVPTKLYQQTFEEPRSGRALKWCRQCSFRNGSIFFPEAPIAAFQLSLGYDSKEHDGGETPGWHDLLRAIHIPHQQRAACLPDNWRRSFPSWLGLSPFNGRRSVSLGYLGRHEQSRKLKVCRGTGIACNWCPILPQVSCSN